MMRRILFLCVAAGFLVGCQDTPRPTDPDLGEPAFLLSDGTNTGNEDFFFLPPLVDNPVNDDDFDPNEFDPNFDPIVVICGGQTDINLPCNNLNLDPADRELTRFTATTVPPVQVGPDGDLYIAEWNTDEFTLDPILDYRIIVEVDGEVLGFADIDVVDKGNQLKTVAGDDIPLKDGRTLPIKFRVEANLRCQRVIGPCEATVVNLADGGNLFIDLDEDGNDDSGVLFNGGDAGTVSATAVPCAATDIPVDIPVFGNCFTIDVTGLIGDLVNPATVFQCSDVSVPTLAASFGLSVEQLHLLRWHRFDAGAPDVVKALPLTDDPCLELLASSLDANPLMRFARAVRDRFKALVGPRPLWAKTRVRFWDTRSGGSSVRFSDFQLALPSKMEIDAGDGQDALVGTQVAIKPAVLVTDAHGNPVEGATVTFTDDANGTVVPPATATTGATGILEVISWTIDGVGVTELTASCFGCATPGEDFDGPQVSIFDPFTPLPGASPLGPPFPVADVPDVAPTVSDPNEPTLLLGQLVFTAVGLGNFVYTNDNTSGANTVSAFSVDANGVLTQIAGSPFATSGTGSGSGFFASNRATVCSVGNFLYASNAGSNTVSGFSIDPVTGNLISVPGSPFSTGGLAGAGISLAETPDGQFLMAGNAGSSNVTVFRIAANGALTPITGSPFSAGASPDGMRVTPDGKFLAVAFPFALSGSVGMFTIAPSGALTPVTGSPFPDGGAGIATGVDINAASNLVFVGEATGGNTIVDVFSIAANGALAPIAGSPFLPGVGSNSNVPLLSPDDLLLFVSNQASNSVTVFGVAAGGSLMLVAGSPFPVGGEASQTSGMATNSVGTFLYTANFSSHVGVFSIAANGVLTSVPGSPFSTGQGRESGLLSLTAFPPRNR